MVLGTVDSHRFLPCWLRSKCWRAPCTGCGHSLGIHSTVDLSRFWVLSLHKMWAVLGNTGGLRARCILLRAATNLAFSSIKQQNHLWCMHVSVNSCCVWSVNYAYIACDQIKGGQVWRSTVTSQHLNVLKQSIDIYIHVHILAMSSSYACLTHFKLFWS